MIRVLQDLSALDGGGVAKLLYEYYKNMDHEKIHFDFMIYNFYAKGIYEKPLKEMGCTIYKLPSYLENPKECSKLQEKIIKEGDYDVIHSHFGFGGFRIMRIAKKYHVRKRIVHSHIAYEPYSFKTRIANIVKRELIKYYATDLAACGKDAGEFMWGKRMVAANHVRIIRNAIDTQKFQFSMDLRIMKRIELGVESKYVIGIVSRLSEQKNFPFLFRVYKNVLRIRDDAILLVIGRGLEEKEIRKMAEDMGIANRICFLGVRNDVSEILNALDVFVLPSLYEGLPVVLIEAQANGLQEIVSDKVTSEMDISDLIKFLPIENTEQKWAEVICNCIDNTERRANYARVVAEAGYEIRSASVEMEELYKL